MGISSNTSSTSFLACTLNDPIFSAELVCDLVCDCFFVLCKNNTQTKQTKQNDLVEAIRKKKPTRLVFGLCDGRRQCRATTYLYFEDYSDVSSKLVDYQVCALRMEPLHGVRVACLRLSLWCYRLRETSSCSWNGRMVHFFRPRSQFCVCVAECLGVLAPEN